MLILPPSTDIPNFIEIGQLQFFTSVIPAGMRLDPILGRKTRKQHLRTKNILVNCQKWVI